MAPVDAATGLKPAYSFDQFVVGPNNHVAVGACQAVVKAPGETYNPLVVYGPAGVGKTHLMQAAAHEMLVKNPSFKVKYISAERFMNEIVTAIAEDRVIDIRKAYSALDLLIIDDVQYLVESKIAQEELFHIFNNMHQENRQVILAADRTPNQLASLSKGIRSRLEWGLAADIQPPDENTRLEILRRKQSVQGMSMSDDMLRPAARALRSNVRELEGFLKRLHAYVTLSHQELSMNLVQAVVRELAPDSADVAANGASLNNESPGLSPAPGIAPALTKVLHPENGHKNGKNGAHKNGKAADGADDLEREEKVVRKPPVPPPDLSALTEVLDGAKDTPAAKKPAKDAPAPAPAAAAPAAPPAPPKAEPAPAAPPPAKAAPPMQAIPESPDAAMNDDPDMPAGHKEVAAVFFFPEGKTEELETVHRKFQEVIKKHKLKFRLKRAHDDAYAFKGKVDYARFSDVCKERKAPVAIVIGPPPESLITEQDFNDPLTVALDGQNVSVQLVSWGEINKDYRYLNLALDIALVRAR